MSLLPIVLVTGTTASGKTSFLHGLLAPEDVVISADSKQVYRSLNIGTAKPSFSALSWYRYHLVDCLDLNEKGHSAYHFLETLMAFVKKSPQNRPLFVIGGPSLYTDVLFEGLPISSAETPDKLRKRERIRKELVAEWEKNGLEVLLQELALKDSGYYAQVDKQNPRRVLRALEVIRLTGRTYVSFRSARKRPPFRVLTLVLVSSRRRLYERIGRRVRAMMEQGWLDEVEGLLSQGVDREKLRGILGYGTLLLHLEGKIPWDEVLIRIEQETCSLAKRQITWMKRMKRGVFITFEREDWTAAEDRWLGEIPEAQGNDLHSNGNLGKVMIQSPTLEEVKEWIRRFDAH